MLPRSTRNWKQRNVLIVPQQNVTLSAKLFFFAQLDCQAIFKSYHKNEKSYHLVTS